jgi:hypothetical protein
MCSQASQLPSIYLLTYILRFVDRDMMMRYLGWGIGHRNPPDFAHEANALVASSSDRELEHRGNPAMTQTDNVANLVAEGDEIEDGDRSSVGSEDSDVESVQSEAAIYDY